MLDHYEESLCVIALYLCFWAQIMYITIIFNINLSLSSENNQGLCSIIPGTVYFMQHNWSLDRLQDHTR